MIAPTLTHHWIHIVFSALKIFYHYEFVNFASKKYSIDGNHRNGADSNETVKNAKNGIVKVKNCTIPTFTWLLLNTPSTVCLSIRTT
jgi:hypothetical protein